MPGTARFPTQTPVSHPLMEQVGDLRDAWVLSPWGGGCSDTWILSGELVSWRGGEGAEEPGCLGSLMGPVCWLQSPARMAPWPSQQANAHSPPPTCEYS